jgi:hypothetical protein
MINENNRDSKIFRTYLNNVISSEEIFKTTGADLKKKYPLIFNSFLGISFDCN